MKKSLEECQEMLHELGKSVSTDMGFVGILFDPISHALCTSLTGYGNTISCGVLGGMSKDTKLRDVMFTAFAAYLNENPDDKDLLKHLMENIEVSVIP